MCPRGLITLLALCASVSPAQAATAPLHASATSEPRAPATTTASSPSANPQAPVPVTASNAPPTGRRLSANRVLAIAAALPKMRAVHAHNPGSYAGAYLKLGLRWQVSYFDRSGKKELGQVIIDDPSGRVLEQWTGFQVPWTMARGYPGAFGRHVNALYIWLPLCLLFAAPFLNPRRPLSLLHLDVFALLFFSVSLAFFNHAHIYASVPLVYPPLLYLLARMILLARRRPARARRELALLVPVRWLALATVVLLGFRIALNVTDSNVIDVGYAGVIGAQRIVAGHALYGRYPADNEHGDTYGPANYLAYVPFQQLFGWSGKWDDLPAAHAAAIAFDLLALALLFLLGRRVRGPTLGIVLAYAWVSYPFTLFALESNSNDTLVAALVLAALLAASYTSALAAGARGAFAALAGLTKFAPLALAPLLATYVAPVPDEDAPGAAPLRPPHRGAGRAAVALAFCCAFALVTLLAFIPALRHASLNTIYQRTVAYQADRGSPFSVWGLYGGLGGVQLAVQIASLALVAWLALAPAGRDLVGLTAACAAVLIALQLGIEHWFYLYIPWFFPLVMLALLGSLSPARSPHPAAASAPARSSPRAAAASSV